MSGPVLQVDGLALAFGGVRAIDGLSFEVMRGEVFAIIGPNGAGKTSVFNVITRVFDPLSGSVRVNGQDMLALRRHQVIRAGVARTFQNIELFEGASVLDNLMLGRHRFDQGSFLAQCLRLQNKNLDEAAAVETRFKHVWAHADVTLTSSCFCQPGS